MSALEDPTTCNADRERLLDRIPGVALGNEDDVRRSAAVNVNKRYISSTCPFQYFCRTHSVLPSAFRDEWSGKTMKLFRTAFWLGLVIFNLPSPEAKLVVPPSQLSGSQGLAKAPSQSCPQPLEPCAKKADALSKRADPGRHSSSRESVTPPQDTLAPADRAVPWRGPALRNAPPVSRTAAFFRNTV